MAQGARRKAQGAEIPGIRIAQFRLYNMIRANMIISMYYREKVSYD